jgi:predicted HAD superfamily Cof-like phosphohydrolase
MAVPWLAVGSLVLGNLDKIMGVMKPGFTRKKVEVASAQFDLLNQQIAELQGAASTNAEQITQLAAQVKEVVEALAQAAALAATERAAVRRLSYLAIVASALAVVLVAILAFSRA